jgi:hypothetical protein
VRSLAAALCFHRALKVYPLRLLRSSLGVYMLVEIYIHVRVKFMSPIYEDNRETFIVVLPSDEK